jgi:cell division protein FtsB
MKNELMVIPFVFVTIGLIFGAILGTSFSVNEILKLEKENSELKAQNERLEKIVKELDREQAERTRITAERNGVGG